MQAKVEGVVVGQVLRYLINGLAATAVHYSVLKFNMEILNFGSAALANMCAAVFGISVSFLGSRYFVFKQAKGDLVRQSSLFLLIYCAIAVLHGMALFIWTDRLGWDYRVGFLIATGAQMAFSFMANKFLVFK